MPPKEDAETALFAYGSLMFPEVWLHVVGRQRRSLDATLAGHLAFTVRGYSFPGLVPSSAADTTSGHLYFDLSAEDWRRLDAFEDTFYQRVPVVAAAADGRAHAASAYVVLPEHTEVLSEVRWDAGRFAEHALGDFLDRICGFDPGDQPPVEPLAPPRQGVQSSINR